MGRSAQDDEEKSEMDAPSARYRTNCRSFDSALRAPLRMTGLWWAFGWGAGERRGPFELGRLCRSFDSRFALAQDDNEKWGVSLRVTSLWWAFGWGAGERRGPFELGRLRRSFDSRFALAQDDNEKWGVSLRMTKSEANGSAFGSAFEQTAGPSASFACGSLRSG